MKIRIDPSAAMGGTVSQYIDSVKFIILETTPKSVFGNIDQLKITDQFYIILDEETNAILIFDKQGKFHAKIEGKKIEPDAILSKCYLDKKNNLIEIPMWRNSYFFDMEGRLVKKSKNGKWIYSKSNDFGTRVAYRDYIADRRFQKDSIAFELMISEKGLLVAKYFPYNIKYATLQGADIFYNRTYFYPDYASDDTAIYYLRPYNYYVYRITPHKLEAVYHFIFPVRNSLPKNFTTDSSFNGKRKKYIIEHMDVVSKLGNFYKKDNLLFINANATYIYNVQSQWLISMNKIVSDSGSYFLPITDAEVGGVGFSNQGVINFDGRSFYTSISSMVLFNQMEATKSKMPNYPQVLSEYFSDKKNYRTNPVLVQIQFKPNL